jgi:hypothetical protein
MESLQIHQILNYYPPILTALATILLGFGLASKSDRVVRISLGGFPALALLALIVAASGESASRELNLFTGPFANPIKDHRFFAFLSLVAVCATGILSIYFNRQIRRDSNQPSTLAIVVFLFAVLASILLALTTEKGRRILTAPASSRASIALVEKTLWHV